LRGLALLRTGFEPAACLGLTLLRDRALDRDDLDDRRADEDAITFVQQRAARDLLAVHERTVRGAHVLDVDLCVGRADLRVPTRDHVFDEHHVQVARPANDDFPIHAKRELASLVLARDEAQCEARTVVHVRKDSKILVLNTLEAQANGPDQSVAGMSSYVISWGGLSVLTTRR